MFEALRHLVTSLAIASVIGSAAQGYAMASSNPGASASGAQISTAGLAISGVHYESSAAFVTAVRFQVSSSSGAIRIRLNPNGGWTPCSNVGGDVRCPTGDFPASAVEQLSVVAS